MQGVRVMRAMAEKLPCQVRQFPQTIRHMAGRRHWPFWTA